MKKNIAGVLLYTACAVLVVFYISVMVGEESKGWNRIQDVLFNT